MKRSHGVVLTAVVAAASVIRADAQPPATPADAVDCREAGKTAKQGGPPVPQNCVLKGHGVAHGGFGFLGRHRGAAG
jgi:hypothetical protein